jgi:hypothetical protein
MVCGTIAAAMAAEIIANAIIAALADGAVAIDKLEAEPDSGDRRHTVFEEPKDINSASDPELVSIALIHTAGARL